MTTDAGTPRQAPRDKAEIAEETREKELLRGMSSDAVRDAAETMSGWFPNECQEYRELVLRCLSSLPGGEQAEEFGFEPYDFLGWQEADMLGKLLAAVRDAGDVARVVQLLIGEPQDGVTDDA